jgi:hypothetical protein
MSMFYIGLAVGIMLGSLCGVAFVSMVVVAKEADERMERK